MGPDGDLYKIVLVLHLMAAIVGFGGFMYSGALGAHAAARRNSAGAAVADANFKMVTGFSEWPIYAVPVLGIILLLMSDDVWKFSQAWISLSLLVYIAFVGVLHGVHLPALRRMNSLLGDLPGSESPTPEVATSGAPPQAAELDHLGRKLGVIGGVLNLLIVLAVILMVFKPGV